ncbi:MAG: hypothetical protein NVSMB21_12870 [Vulcanimicrobiaceae bacterium]
MRRRTNPSLSRRGALGTAPVGLAAARVRVVPGVAGGAVPLAGAVVLPTEPLRARAAIERAAALRHDSERPLAKTRYRRALDAYRSGGRARSRRDADAARSLADGSRTKGP